MKFLLLITALLFSRFVFGQTVVPFDSTHWTFAGKAMPETFKGRECVSLSGGRLTLKDSTFRNGILEFDIAMASERHFPGLNFRIQDGDHFERVYLRPHRVGNPDAIQYIPINNNLDSWQFYYGEGYSATVTYPLNEWVHIKLVVRETQGEVYVGDLTKPALVIHQLKRQPQAGPISLDNGASVAVRFANFRYTKTDSPPMVGPFKTEASTPPGTLLNWEVSSPFHEKQLETGYTIPQPLTNRLSWDNLTAEKSGKLIVSTIRKHSEANNTVFVKLTLMSDKPQVKKLDFGFSDRVRVYLNGQLMYAGHDEFLSRDYRFLGTVGYYDALYLNLKKGKNELWMAVSENFGGWGIQAKIVDQTGLTVLP